MKNIKHAALISFLACLAVLPVNASENTFAGGAHWYGGEFHGRRTASGARFDKHGLSAAHPSLPFGTRVRVKSLHTGKDVVVVVNDRCPPVKQRCIDLSQGAAKEIGIWPHAPNAVHCETLAGKGSIHAEVAVRMPEAKPAATARAGSLQ